MEWNEHKFKINERLKNKSFDLILKRIMDLTASLILFILLIPALLIIAIAIKKDSEGPAIFTQIRVGLDGKPFKIYKFRTMVKNAERLFKLDIDKDNLGSLVFQDKGDSRVTKIGAFLRRTSLDELPQLMNVIIGNMSLVGPRPEIPSVADYYNKTQKLRLKVLPGITGLAQVSGRGEIELDETIKYDIEYIENYSIWLDIKILFKTISVVLRGQGAY
ncbi:UDP-glucose:undecaprenyl-phosphate glucose-1-phosphate transferase [Oxobacter pfennigii]|uniref:UDP-glucose:undecaprenyl-phosphate glucose-1-phosphate transferase n=1 Tax=Oxobacter pfennigii TaxID=36849 RepID=A0A0P8X3J6_9CLOT|nr:exopolysaccharide biosynthesis polyprenyl glycosylphosphotransferase [Oxobacter pfennigii]KPU45362.1 UDP-glucose:undecaprenyl-phosphate glucose-1-phosphate transferase [Oxobacter pfennigii]